MRLFKLLLIVVIFMLTLYSCGGTKRPKVASVQEGVYTGYFVRSSPLARFAPAPVTLTVKSGRFSGNSERANYPAIGEGTFQAVGNQLEFFNENMWTADFDWTYILKGRYAFTITGDKLAFTKVEGDVTDHYELELKKN